MTSMSLEFVTCSYRPDFDNCALLCASMDRFVDDSLMHTLVVPRRDLALFSSLASHRRHIVIAEEVLPRALRRLPVTKKWWLFKGYLPLRGWYIQQLLKLSAPLFVRAQAYINVDSDVFFIKTFDAGIYQRANQTRLYFKPEDPLPESHQLWHKTSAAILGCGEAAATNKDYIASLVSWRTETVRALQHHIETRHGCPWQHVLASRRGWSEYTLYGLYVENIAGPENQFLDASRPTLCSWDFDMSESGSLDRLCNSLSPQHNTVHIQSYDGLDISSRTRLFERFSAQALTFTGKDSLL